MQRLGEKATIESTINSIEDLMNNTSDDKTAVEDIKNGDKTSDETQSKKTEETEETDPNVVIDEKEKERKRLEYEEKIKQRRLERECMTSLAID